MCLTRSLTRVRLTYLSSRRANIRDKTAWGMYWNKWQACGIFYLVAAVEAYIELVKMCNNLELVWTSCFSYLQAINMALYRYVV